MKLINRNNLLATKFASQEESRYAINAILVTEHETVGTDGHILARVSLPNVPTERFPAIDGFTPNGFTSALLPVKTAIDIEKSIAKKNSNYPILENAAITTHDNKIQVAAIADLSAPKVITVHPVDGQFPNWERRFDRPTTEVDGQEVELPYTTDITLSAELLKRVADAAIKFAGKQAGAPVRLRFTTPNNAVRFDVTNDEGQEMNGLIMPMRTDVKPTFRS